MLMTITNFYIRMLLTLLTPEKRIYCMGENITFGEKRPNTTSFTAICAKVRTVGDDTNKQERREGVIHS